VIFIPAVRSRKDSVKNGTRGGLSRLLNLTDDLIGATQDFIFLLTTNSHPASFDLALTRTGRCLATTAFETFPTRGANERLGTYGPAARSMTLAEIYQRLGDDTHLQGAAGDDWSVPLGESRENKRDSH